MSESEQPVVVGYDESPGSDAAVSWAAVEAARRDRALVVLVATDAIRHMTDLLSLSGVSGGTLEEEAKKVADHGVEVAKAAAPSVDVQPHVSSTGAVAALCEAAQDASLLVVGSSGHGRVMHALSGSVAFAVVTHAKVSVVAVRSEQTSHAGPEHPVVVGVDGSAGSDLAVDQAANIASETGAELVVVAAWETPRSDHWSRVYLADDEWRKEDIDRARGYAHMLVGRARTRAHEQHPDLTVRESVQEGRPEQVITHAHDEAALVVVGARGHGDFRSLLLGSVGRGVVHRAHCPVAIIR
ncbi:MAG: universal stress protein [Ornithinimicrobium sp.]